jgi:hypothetical protein
MPEEIQQQENNSTEERESLSPISLNLGPLTLSSSSGTANDLSANLRLFQNSTRVPPGNLSLNRNGDNYSIGYTGGYPLRGNFGPIASEGLSLDSIRAGSGGLQELAVSANNMRIGENFQLNGVSARLSGAGENFSVTATSAAGNVMGHSFIVNSPTVVIDNNGNFVEASFGEFNGDGISMTSGRLTPNGLSIASAGVALPEIYGQALEVNFANLDLNAEGYSGTGTISAEEDLTFINNTLSVSNFLGTADIQSNSWNVNVQGDLNYTEGATTITAKGDLSAGEEGTTFALSQGTVNTDLNGIIFTSEGLEYESTTDMLTMDSGNASTQILGGTVDGTLTQASYGADGFDFETVTLTTTAVQLFPGMQMDIGSATITNAEGNYTFALENGVLSYTSEAISGSGTISVWVDNQGMRGTLVGPQINSNFLDISAEGEINFTDTGINIPSASFTVKNLGPAADAALTVNAEGVEYGSSGLNITTLNVDLPQIGPIDANAVVDNINVGEAGISATGGRVELTGEEISLVGGLVTVSEFNSIVNITDAGWEATLSGNLSAANEQTTAEGSLRTDFGSAVENAFTLENGRVSSDINGIIFTSEGLEYESTTDMLQAETTEVSTEAFGTNIKGTIQNATVSAEGFDYTEVSVETEGEAELLPGLVVPEFVGYLRKNESGAADIEMLGSVNFNNPVLSGGASSVTYNYTEGEHSFDVEGLNVDSDYFSFNAESASYSSAEEILNISSSDFSVKNLGAVGEAAEVSTGSIQWSASGLEIADLNAGLPPIGDIAISAQADKVNVGEAGVTVENGTVEAEGDLSFADNALAVNNISGAFNVAEGAWDASITGAIAVNNVANTTASGNLTIEFGQDGTTFNLEDGEIQSTLAGLTLTATGISINSEDPSILSIDTATLEVPELDGGDLTATIAQVSFGPNGFDFQSVAITSTGTFELLPGFVVSGLGGTLTNEGAGEYGIEAEATGTLTSSALNGGATVNFNRTGGASSFELTQFNLQTNLFDFTVESAVFEENKLTVESVDLDLKNLGAASDGLQASAQAIEYSAQGLSIGHLEADFPQIGEVNVGVSVDNLNIPSGGGITGSGTVTVDSEITLAGGAVTLNNVGGTVDFQENAWGVEVTAGLGYDISGVSGGGDVTVSYGSENGIDVGVENGTFNASYAGITLAGEGINYSYSEDKFGIDTTTVSMPQLGAEGVEATVDGLSIQNGDIDFDGITIQINQTVTIINGLDATLESASLEKEGESITTSITIGAELDDSNFGIGGSGRGTIEYNLGNNEFSGSLDSLSINTPVFDVSISNGAEINQDGFNIGQATLGFSDDLDVNELERLIPQAGELGAMALNALKGVNVVATDVSYNSADGFSVGDWSLEFAKISFDVMGLSGEMDLAELSASLSGSKTFDLDDFNIPTSIGVDVPIVPGVEATGSIGLGANLTIGAGINAQGNHDSDVWRLGGSLDVSGTVSARLRLGIELDAVVASAGAALQASINAGIEAGAGIGMSITYDPETNSVALADEGLDFNYNLLAEIYTALDLVLYYEVLFGVFEDEEVINLARWDIGSLHLSGESNADTFAELFSNLENDAHMMIDGDRYNL